MNRLSAEPPNRTPTGAHMQLTGHRSLHRTRYMQLGTNRAELALCLPIPTPPRPIALARARSRPQLPCERRSSSPEQYNPPCFANTIANPSQMVSPSFAKMGRRVAKGSPKTRNHSDGLGFGFFGFSGDGTSGAGRATLHIVPALLAALLLSAMLL